MQKLKIENNKKPIKSNKTLLHTIIQRGETMKMNKKAMIFTSPRDTISFVVGLILIAFGLIPLLNKFGAIKWNLPGFLVNLPTSVLVWIVAIAGLYILIDGFIEPPMHM
ncbi:MAG: hypothetical protein N3D84_03825, partial [Candidatus Woesearchaeota archaeon]|nr:hypothetical protein [Candidatus Woesearchaeota archaeon]